MTVMPNLRLHPPRVTQFVLKYCF